MPGEVRVAPEPLSKGTEQDVVSQVAAVGIRLRFDEVACRLVESVEAIVAKTLPVHRSIAFTVTAPIKLPAKTSAAISKWLDQPGAERLSATLYGNQVRARVIDDVPSGKPKVVGLVHNQASDAELALDIVESALRGHLPAHD